MQFKLAIPENDDELRQQVQKFIDYGAPFPCRRARSAARSICQPAWAATLAEEPSMWRR